jgi:transposase
VHRKDGSPKKMCPGETVPQPGNLGLMGSGLIGIYALVRKESPSQDMPLKHQLPRRHCPNGTAN